MTAPFLPLAEVYKALATADAAALNGLHAHAADALADAVFVLTQIRNEYRDKACVVTLPPPPVEDE